MTGGWGAAAGPLSSGTRNSPQIWQKLASGGLRWPWLQRCPAISPHTPQTSIPGETECPRVQPDTPARFLSLRRRLTMLRDPATAGDALDEAGGTGHGRCTGARVRNLRLPATLPPPGCDTTYGDDRSPGGMPGKR